MDTWQVFQRGMEIEAERQFKIYMAKRVAASVAVGFILGMLVAYGIR